MSTSAATPATPQRRPAPFDLARTVASLAAGDIEAAFEHLLEELRPAGVRGGALLAETCCRISDVIVGDKRGDPRRLL